MKIKEGFTLRPLLGEHIVVGEGLAQVNFNKMLTLNASAAYLWEQVADKEFTREDLVRLLVERYEVSAGQAGDDVDRMLAVWLKEGIAE